MKKDTIKADFCETKSKKACMGCPFKRINTNEKPNPGGSHPFVYLGQARGPFWLPCHNDKNYIGKGSDISKVSQCRGAAIFRSNCNMPYDMPKELLSLPQNTTDVFESEAEFLSHYIDAPLHYCESLLTDEGLDGLMKNELNNKSENRRYK